MATSYKSRFSSRASNLSSRASTSNSNSTSESSSSGFWILIIVLIVLIIGSIMTGSFYKKYENFTNPDPDDPKSYTLQYYCMERCGHCQDFEKEIWTGYSQKVNSSPSLYYFDTVKYDIMEPGIGKEMGDKYNITSTPTILLYNSNTKKVYSFMAERTAAKLTEFANEIIKSEHPTWTFT